MMARYRTRPIDLDANTDADDVKEAEPVPRGAVIAVVIGFIALQATNSAAVSIMSLFVTERLGLALIWSGIALGASALLEIPALLIIGRLSQRISSHTLIMSGCITGTVYYIAMAFVADPITLVLLQVLNAWFFGIVAGVGLTTFQEMIPRPGLASGLFTNTRRLGAIVVRPDHRARIRDGRGLPRHLCRMRGAAAIALVLVELARRIADRSATRTRTPTSGLPTT